MGSRTYIYGDGDYTWTCLGKLVAYTDPDKLPNLKAWCDKNITDKEDRTYLFGGVDEDGDEWPGFFNIGYCHEHIEFQQKFDRDQISEFITSFIRDKKNGPYPIMHTGDYITIGKLLRDASVFAIEWTEGG